GLSWSAMPPLEVCVGRRCFFDTATCSTRIRPVSGNTRRTLPCLPLSLPLMTFTVSLRRMSTLLCSVAVLINSRFQGFRVSRFHIVPASGRNLETFETLKHALTELLVPGSQSSKTSSRAALEQLGRTRAFPPARPLH